MISRTLIEDGRKRGHEIYMHTIRPNRNESIHDADLHWLIDVYNYPHTIKSRGAWLHYPRNLLSEIAESGHFIHMSNAYVDVCNLEHLPCSGNVDIDCLYKSGRNLLRNVVLNDFSHKCFTVDPLVRKLFTCSALNIYLSPLHKETIEKILGAEEITRSFILKPLIDSSIFYNKNYERDIEYLFVGLICEAKGLETMRKEFEEQDIHFVGNIARGEKLDFGTYHGSVPYDEVANLMNRASKFVFLPRWPEPQGRVVVEAALCGCELITNKNVGATSFPFDISIHTNFENSSEEFWCCVETLV